MVRKSENRKPDKKKRCKVIELEKVIVEIEWKNYFVTTDEKLSKIFSSTESNYDILLKNIHIYYIWYITQHRRNKNNIENL